MNKNSINEKQTRVLFNWKPRELDHDIGIRLRRRLMKAGLYTHPYVVEVRSPDTNAQQDAGGQGWHRDATAPNTHLIMWSNIRPTLVRFKDGSLLEAKDGDVLLVDNDEVTHCAPEDQSNRWFLRTLIYQG